MPVSSYSGPLACDLSPNVENAWGFLSWWFEFCSGGLVELGWTVPSSGQLTAFRRFDVGDLSVLKTIAEANCVPGQNVYVRMGLVDPASMVGRTRDVDIVCVPGVWADLDTLEQVDRARLVQSMVRANGWTRTGLVPHPRFQMFMRCAVGIRGVDLIRSLNRRMWKLYGGDSAVANPGRLMRVPGTIAWPYKDGRVPELTQFDPAPADRPSAYPLSVLQERLPHLDGESSASATSAGAEGAAEGSADSAIDAVSRLIADIRNGACGWHNGMIRLVAMWVGRGWSNSEILLACEGLTMPGWTVLQTREEAAKAIEGARRKGFDGSYGGDWGGATTTAGYPAQSSSWARMIAHKPRNWIYGHHLIRGFVSLLAAPGGTGKSAYAVCAALAIVTNASEREMLKERVHTAGKVWICNLEDPLDELDRRVLAACIHYKFGPADIEDRLYLTSGRDQPLVVAAAQKDGSVMVSPVIEQLIAEIKRLEIDALVIDPFIRSHRVLENANEQMDVVMAQWARVAKEANCAVWLVHHFRKSGNGGNADSFRGASALIDAARAALSLTVMSEKEAERYGIKDEERWQYVRLDNAKLNLAPPPDVATWLKLVGVDLGNAADGRPADNVQTVERWAPPSAWHDMPWSMIIRILETIDAGMEDGEFYSPAVQANKRWVGNVIMNDASRTKAQAAEIVKQWLGSDPPLLVEGEYNSPGQHARSVKCVRVNNEQLQRMRRQAASSSEFENSPE